jgi:dTMP kinase
MNKLIVIEGACDGIGKTTQFNLLKEKLEQSGYKVKTHHFPTYNTYQGEGVTEYLSGKFGNPSEVNPYFAHNLYAVDRAVTWAKEMQNLDENEVILLDRYTTSSIIYQTALLKEPEKTKFIDFINDYEFNILKIQKPDIVIYLHADFDVVTNLRNSRTENDGIKNDIHESNLDFMKKVYQNSEYASEYLRWKKIECSDDKNMKSIDEIHNEIWNEIQNIL